MKINFIKYRRIYFIFSGILVISSIVCLILFGLRFGIDFTGGSILEVNYLESRPSNIEIKNALSGLDLGELIVQPTGEKGVILRMKDISEEMHRRVLEKLKQTGEIEQLRFELIGPTIGKELKQKTRLVIFLSLLSIILYIAWAFRQISFPVSSWQYGLAALIALFHDVLIPVGVFSILGKFYGVNFTIPIVTALLTVFGYSINDTVVVFDRIRENLLKQKWEEYEKIVNDSLNQTLTRSVNTSLTTLLVLFALFFFGGDTLKYFSLALIIGTISGTYSSIFLASPLLVSWLKYKESHRQS